MAQYAFYRAGTDERATLAEVDDRLCAALGAEPIPDRFHPSYEMIVWRGFALLLDSGGSRVTPEMIEARNAKDPEFATPELTTLLKDFLGGGIYTFEAWR